MGREIKTPCSAFLTVRKANGISKLLMSTAWVVPIKRKKEEVFSFFSPTPWKKRTRLSQMEDSCKKYPNKKIEGLGSY